MKEIQRDPIYERAIEFAKHYMKEHDTVGFSNMYVIRRLDADGNVLGEYYGMNLMTDYGMQQYFIENGGANNFPQTIYFGNGVGAITVAENSLISQISNISSTLVSGTIMYDYPLYYAVETGLITTTCRFMIAQLPAIIDGISQPFVISEYGIGTGPNALWTHSYVYDNLGRVTTITKSPNEALEFNVYFCLSYSKQMIESNWNDGKYTVITSMKRFFRDGNKKSMEESTLRTFKRDNIYGDTTKTSTRSAFDNVTHTMSVYTNLSEYNIISGTDAKQAYTDGYASYTDGFLMVEHDVNPTPENVNVVISPVNDVITDNDSLTYNFGATSRQPFTQLDASAVYSFNHATGDYTSSEPFTQTASKWYNETLMSTSFAVPIFYTTNQTITQMYVYQNIKTDDPIIKIRGALSTVYATDEYWNTSSWHLITDLNNVPVADQSKKYWITPNNTVNLNPLRGNTPFSISSEDGGMLEFTTTFPADMQNFCVDPVDNYFVLDNYIYDMNEMRQSLVDAYEGWSNTRSFTVYSSATAGRSTTHSKIVTIHPNMGTYLLSTYDTSTHQWSSASTSPVKSIDNLWNCYITSSEGSGIHPAGNRPYVTGFVCFVGTNALYTENNNLWFATNGSQSYGDGKCVTACMILNTAKLAFINAASNHQVSVRDMINQDLPDQTFNIPSAVATPVLMFGYSHFVYVSDGATYMYVIDITANTVTACDGYVPFTTTIDPNIRQTAVDDCMIIYHANDSNMSHAYLLRADNPTHLSNLGGLTTGTSTQPCLYTLKKWCDTVILIYTSDVYNVSYRLFNQVFDLSKWLYNETKSCYDQFSVDVNGHNNVMIPFGERIIEQNVVSKITNYIYHRIVGTTETITALNHTKRIIGKQWSVTFTNNPSFNGLPPGILQ